MLLMVICMFKMGINESDVVLSGHTHVQGIFKLENGIVNINPGSTTLPKGGTQKGFAIVDEKGVELYNLGGERLDAYHFS